MHQTSSQTCNENHLYICQQNKKLFKSFPVFSAKIKMSCDALTASNAAVNGGQNMYVRYSLNIHWSNPSHLSLILVKI